MKNNVKDFGTKTSFSALYVVLLFKILSRDGFSSTVVFTGVSKLTVYV